jgi:hypothetical protein
MLARYHPSETPVPLRKIAQSFRLLGWVGFWLQLVLAFLAAIALLFAISGRSFSPDPYVATGIGIFWGISGVVLLVVGILFEVRYIRISRGLNHEPGAVLHPHKANTIRLLRWGVVVGFIGMLVALLGSGASVMVLLAKTVSQPPGVAIVDPNKIVRALDVFVVLANLTLIAAHLAGTVIAFWLLDRVHHYQHPIFLHASLES